MLPAPLQSPRDCATLQVTDGWVTCPICRRNRRLLRITPETSAAALPVYCRDCKTEIVVNIARGQSVERRSP